MKNNIFTFFVLSIVAASCSSQKYSRTANTVDDVYFVPGNEQFVFAEVHSNNNSEDNNQGFSFDNSPATANPNSSNRDRYSYSNNTNEVQETPSGFEHELFNESPRNINVYNNFNSFDPFWNPAFAMNGRMSRSMFWNYYAYNSFSPWNRPGFQISYSPNWGWNIGLNYGMPMWNNPWGMNNMMWGNPYGMNYMMWNNPWGMNNMMWGNPFYDPFCPWGGMYGNNWGWGGMQVPISNGGFSSWNTNKTNRLNSNFAPRRSGNSANPSDNQGNSRRSETIYNQGGRGGTSITPGQSERRETVPQGNTTVGTRQEPNQNAAPAGRNRYNYSNSPSQPSTAPNRRDNSPTYAEPSNTPSYAAPSSRPSSTPSYSAPSSRPSSTPSYSAPSSRPSSTPSYSAPSSRPSSSPSSSPSRGGESGGSAPRRR